MIETATTPPPVILFVFAGRRPNLELQLPMARRIIQDYPNVEYHVWNFARNDKDRKYVKTIEGERITVWNGTDGAFASPAPTNEPGAKQFGANEHNAAYQHYSQPEFKNHLFMKVDDDIVFLETARFGQFVEALDTHRGSMLLANIINNGASTPVEPGVWAGFQKLGIPLLDIHLSTEFAEMAHSYMFKHYDKVLGQPIKLIPTADWTSINAAGYDWNTLRHVLKTIGKPQPRYLAGRSMSGWGRVFGDEGVFQTLPRIIVKGFTAAHLTFGPQDKTAAQLEAWRRSYRILGERYLNSEASTVIDLELPELSEEVSNGQGPCQWQGDDGWRGRWTKPAGENDPLCGRYQP